MLFGQASNSLSLFGPPATQEPVSVADTSAPSFEGPQLSVPWGSFRQSARSSFVALFSSAPVKFLGAGFFRDCWVERSFPRRALLAAGLWHTIFLVAPWPQLASPRRNPTLENFQLTWSGPINDLPALNLSPTPAAAKPTPRGEVQRPPAPAGADAFHPRQRIFTDPTVVTHPRQTLINPAAPALAPKILPSMPNVVELQPVVAPPKPHIEISEKTLAQLHPRERRAAAAKIESAPDVAAAQAALSPISLAPAQNAPARPKLELNAGAPPRMVQQQAQPGDSSPAPELANQSGTASSTLIALSATPGPTAPPAPPQGNLAARVAISPEGKQPGSPGGERSPVNSNGGTAGAADARGGNATGAPGGKNSTAVSISGGNPTAKSSGLDGNPQPKIDSPAPRGLITKIDPRARIPDTPERTGPPNFAALPPGAKPEQVFASKKVYTLLVNMPNLNSATGSWILNFSELRSSSTAPHVTPADISGPSPIRKSDPKYPPTLINEHVEGEVVLYAVIRADGSVDSVELVRGIDEQLDNNAMQAFSQWKFRPASREGAAVDLEAIVHIPFHTPSVR